MKIVLISGSGRKDSQSLKITTWLDRQLKNIDVETEVLDLQQIDLPIRHEDIWQDMGEKVAEDLRSSLESADGFVVVSPEWAGMASPALKNMFLYVNKAMAHKPALLATVSSGGGGAYPIAELRTSSYKNSYLTYIPEHLRITEAEDKFEDDDITQGEKGDVYLKTRAVHSLELLVEYAKALKLVRDSDAPDYETYPFGM